jgi:hypothetical protein
VNKLRFTDRVLLSGWLVLALTPLNASPALPPPSQSASSKDAQAQKQALVKFDPIIMGEMTRDGLHFGFTTYKGSDGESLQIDYTSFGDADQARNYFQAQLDKAAKVNARSEKLSPKTGEVVGERAEVVFSDGSQRAALVILWTDGRTFHEIYSSSIADSLELERIYKY